MCSKKIVSTLLGIILSFNIVFAVPARTYAVAPQVPQSYQELRNLLDPATNPSGAFNWQYWWNTGVVSAHQYRVWFMFNIVPTDHTIRSMFWFQAVPYKWGNGYYNWVLYDHAVPYGWAYNSYANTYWYFAIPEHWVNNYYGIIQYHQPTLNWAGGYYVRNSYLINPLQFYIIVDTNANDEYLMWGNPNTRTGMPIKTNKVATGMHAFTYYLGKHYWAETPTGKWMISSKQPSSGIFGSYFLRLKALSGQTTSTSYALHGTNEPWTIGTWASHGCIRHYNYDIEYLNAVLPVGTIVWTVK